MAHEPESDENDENGPSGAESAMLPVAPPRRNLQAQSIPIDLPTAEMSMTLRPTMRVGKGAAARLNALSVGAGLGVAVELGEPAEASARESSQGLIRPQSEQESPAALDSGPMRVAAPSGNQLGPGDSLGDGRYRLGELLSEGSMARVFRAVQLKTEQTVVIKVLLHAGESRARRAAKRELAALVTVKHRNFVLVIDADIGADDTMWIATEYVPGESLRKRLSRGGRLPLPEALGIMSEVFDGLAGAHESNVLHLDVKPENILLGRGFTKICDLGTAALLDRGPRTTDRGSLVGTAEYMAPERLIPNDDGPPTKPDFRCDLYSAGLCLYEAVAGFHALIPEGLPNGRPLAKETMCLRQVEFPPAVIASIPTPLWELIEELLRKDPAERPESAAAVAERLKEIRATLGAVPGDLEPALAPASVWPNVGRSILVGVAAGMVTLAAVGAGLRGAAFLRARQAAPVAVAPQAAAAPPVAPVAVASQAVIARPVVSPPPASTVSTTSAAPLPEARPRAAQPAVAKAPRPAATSAPDTVRIPLPDPGDASSFELPFRSARPTAALPKPRPHEISDKPPF